MVEKRLVPIVDVEKQTLHFGDAKLGVEGQVWDALPNALRSVTTVSPGGWLMLSAALELRAVIHWLADDRPTYCSVGTSAPLILS